MDNNLEKIKLLITNTTNVNYVIRDNFIILILAIKIMILEIVKYLNR